VEDLKNGFETSEEDAIVLIADEENKARKGLEAIVDRANKAFEGSPKRREEPCPTAILNTCALCQDQLVCM